MEGPIILPLRARGHHRASGHARHNARNVTVSFVDYIKNVAGSEIYPPGMKCHHRQHPRTGLPCLNRVIREYLHQPWLSVSDHQFDRHDQELSVWPQYL